MDVLDHTKQDIEVWRDGVNTRMRVSALTPDAHPRCRGGLGSDERKGGDLSR
ncbi:MAG: hypothetical protein K0S81_4152 [Rhodospirillales bacterium]|nr:hypothetical protein [Rhodospirillales bacterium]